jgi:3-methylcrotonyl-CoA carboxylase alpha subunit
VPETDDPPLIVKAAAGGGGRGMRIVRRREELEGALAAARREAQSGFGDDRVYLERYLERPRHVEIQLLADAHGSVLALGERECSVQRRHQKVLEESPSTALDPDLRARLSDAAIRFATAVGYVGAGTAEFVLEGRDFYFLELNGRIQVEHPVTEAVTGIDLVQWQLRIARGEPLDLQPRFRGAAVEVRLYAEDPRTFLPRSGRIEHLRLPASVRVEAGVAQGDEIGTRYDPLLAKLIASGATRTEALDNLAAALAETEVTGLETNLPFLRWLVAHPALRAGETTTAFLTEYPPLSAPPAALPADVWRGAFRLNLPAPTLAPPPDVDEAAAHHGAVTGPSAVSAPMPGTVIKVHVHTGSTVTAGDVLVVLEAMKMENPLVSPYDGTVRAVHVQEGDRVAGGAVLVELDD